jgi:hypothetical protein
MSIGDKITVEGKKLETMPPELCIIAALVKRLGGEIIISNKELNPLNFTGVMLYQSNNDTIVIKAN